MAGAGAKESEKPISALPGVAFSLLDLVWPAEWLPVAAEKGVLVGAVVDDAV